MTAGAGGPIQRRSFDRSPASAGGARRWAAGVLATWGLDVLADDALLVLSELVANAVLHGRGEIVVSLERTGAGLRIEVCDEGDGTVVVAEGPVDRPSGRGMVIVDQLADRWGVDTTDDGLSVWVELRAGDRR